MAAPRRPSVNAFNGRTTHTNGGGYTSPETGFKALTKDPTVGKRLSSYPHLTPATPTRAEHVTDVTRVSTIVGANAGERFDVHQRFHQDNVHGSTPHHDRFIATNSSGDVFNVNAQLNPALHHGQHAAVPTRGDAMSTRINSALTFTLGAQTNDPPLSPRTRARNTTGY